MAVFTKIQPAQMLDFLSRYEVGSLINYQGIENGVENSNYFVDTTAGQFILTIFENISLNTLDFFVHLMSVCSKKNIPTPKPIADKNNCLTQTLKNKPAILVNKIVGQHISSPSKTHLTNIGKAIAHMHQQLQHHTPKPANTRSLAWMHQTYQRLQVTLTKASQLLIQQELTFQQNMPDISLPKSIIHADLFRDNVLFKQEKIAGIIDLYFACYDNMLLDIAIICNDWCFEEDGQFNHTKYHAFLTHYQSRRPLQSLEKKYFSWFLRLAALRFYLSRLLDKTQQTQRHQGMLKDPVEYEHKLHFHQQHIQEL